MMGAFVAMFMATFNGAVNPPVVPLKPERLAELMKLLSEPTRTYPTPSYDCSICCLRGNEKWELAQHPDSTNILKFFRDRSKPDECRAESAAILAWKLKGFFANPKEEIIQAVADALVDDSPLVRRLTLEVIGLCGLMDHIYQYPNATAYCAVVRLTKSMGRCATDFDDRVCAAACKALWMTNQAHVNIDVLLKAVQREDLYVRAYAVTALSMLTEDPRALAAVLDEFRRSMNAEENWLRVSIQAVGRFGPKAASVVPELVSILERKERIRFDSALIDAKFNALKALGNIGPAARNAIPAIVAYLDQPSENFYSRVEERLIPLILIDASVGMPRMNKYLKDNAAIHEKLKDWSNK